MNVKLIVDVYRYKKQPLSIHVSDVSDYLSACKQIDSALFSGDSLQVILHNSALIKWFDQYRERIKIDIYDPCEEFANALNVSINDLPSEIRQDPSLLVSLELIELAKQCPLRNQQDVLSWLLEQTLDPIWTLDDIKSYEELISLLLLLSSKKASSIPLTLIALREKRIEEWKLKSSFAKTLNWIFSESSKRRAETFLISRLIWGYPFEIKVRALQHGNRWAELTLLENYDSIILQAPLKDCIKFSLPPEVALITSNYLRDQLNEGGIENILPLLSGLTEEWPIVRNYLENNFESIDESWTNLFLQINRIFSINPEATSFLQYIERLTPLKVPSIPKTTATWDEVSIWLEGEYFPYYNWCSALGQLEKTENQIMAFEDWLVKNYYPLTQTKAFAPYSVQSILSRAVIESSALYVIIDGLPWIYSNILQRKLSEKGLNSFDTFMHITTLPSVTRVSKPCLIKGQLPGQLLSTNDYGMSKYEKLLAKSLNITESEILYSNSNDSDISDIIQYKKKVYLFLDNEIDEFIHKPLSQEKRVQKINSHLDEIVNAISVARAQFKRKFGEDLFVVVTSDHGFTEIPKSPNIITFIEDSNCSIDHSRLIEHSSNVSIKHIDNTTNITKEMLGGGNITYSVAKGYSCIGTKPKGAAHGGLTPQEVIIPTFVIDTSDEVTYREVSIALRGEIRRGRSDNIIIIEIANANLISIKVKNIDVLFVSIPKISQIVAANTVFAIETNLDASKIKDEEIKMAGIVTVNFRGRDIVQEFVNVIKTTGAAIADKEFEDAFDI